MDFGDWLQIAFICLIGAVAPGLSFGLVVTNTISRGKLYGVATGIGHGVGICWWAFLSAIGIVKILANYSSIFQICQNFQIFSKISKKNRKIFGKSGKNRNFFRCL